MDRIARLRGRFGSLLDWIFALALLAAGAATVVLPPSLSLALLGLVVFVMILWWKPAWALIALLLARSSADSAQDLLTFLPSSALSFNLAGLMNIAGTGLLVFYLARRFARGESLLPSAPLAAWGVFLGVALLSLPASPDPVLSVKAWARFASYLGIALLALEVGRDPGGLRATLRAITLAAAPPVLLGFYQALTGGGYFFAGYQNTAFAFRPQGTFGHPSILAAFCLTLVCLLLAAYLMNYPLWPRPVLLVGSAVGLLMLALTYARTEWIGAALALAVIMLLRSRRLLVVGVLVALAMAFFVPAIQERLSGEQAGESFEWRLQVWDASLALLRKPTIFGAGLDISPRLLNSRLPYVDAPPHNDYLRTLLEMGLAGMVSWLAVLASLLFQSWQAYRRGSSAVQALGLALLAITAGGMAVALSDNYWSYVSVWWYNWALVGLLAAAMRRSSPSTEPAENERLLPATG